MDGVISMPIALAGYYFLPDVPEISRARYFSEQVYQALHPYTHPRAKFEHRKLNLQRNA